MSEHVFRAMKEGPPVDGPVYEIQKSKFIAHVCHAEDEETARAFVQEMKKRYYDARHNPYAYIIGTEPSTAKMKSNDDGEPGGTAGNPILEILKSHGIADTVLVVTRYFGGIKLGAGGLIRAYSHAAAIGLAAAPIVEMRPFLALAVQIPYDLLAPLEHYLRKEEVRMEETTYAEDVTLHLLLPPDEAAARQEEITDMTAGKAVFAEKGRKRIALPVTLDS